MVFVSFDNTGGPVGAFLLLVPFDVARGLVGMLEVDDAGLVLLRVLDVSRAEAADDGASIVLLVLFDVARAKAGAGGIGRVISTFFVLGFFEMLAS